MPTTITENRFKKCLDILTQGEEGNQLLDLLTSKEFASVEEARAGIKLLGYLKLHLGDWNSRDMTLEQEKIQKNIRLGEYS